MFLYRTAGSHLHKARAAVPRRTEGHRRLELPRLKSVSSTEPWASSRFWQRAYSEELAIARDGLRLAMAHGLEPHAPACSIVARYVPADGIWWICAAVGIEQFGYGFGFTAFMLYLIYFA